MGSSYTKPLPDVTEENEPFWQGCREGELRMQRCTACGHLRYPIAALCPECLSEEHQWEALSGKGEVFSYVVFHQVYNQAFADDVPYNVALVQLDEGPRMFSNVKAADHAQISVGDRLRVVFDEVTDEVSIPRFELDS